MSDRPTTYWAANPDTKAMLAEAQKRIDKWFEHIDRSGKLALWRRTLDEYYSGARTGGLIGSRGEQDELATIKVNHYHNLGEHIVTAIAGQPPAALPQVLNNDHESTSQTVIAAAILEAAVTQRGVDEVFTSTTRRAFVLTEGVASAEWDQALGEDYAADPASDRVVKTGDFRLRTYTPESVVRDYVKESGADHEWYILRRYENRWNVVARAMTKAKDEEQAKRWRDQITGLPNKIEDSQNHYRLIDDAQTQTQDDSDDIAVWEFRHAKTEALPRGRRCIFVSPEVWIEDGPLPFPDLFVFQMRPEEEIGRECGYSQGLDLLAPQHGINAAYSSVLSALAALGHPVIHAQPNSEVSREDMGPFSLVKAAGELKAISLLPADAVKPHAEFAANLIAQEEIISGVNAVRRGNLEATGKLSGSAYALIDAKFLESVVGLQRAFKSFASKVFTAIVQLYKQYAAVERVVQIAGKSNKVYSHKFSGESLKRILRVDIELADPLSRTTSGRLALAEMLLKIPDADGSMMIKTPEQLIQLVRTGRLEPLTESQGKELDNIKAENEMLGDGKLPQVADTDNPVQHIKEHMCVLSSPEARAPDSPVLGPTLMHVQEHLRQLRETDPLLLLIAGVPPQIIQAAQMAMTPPPVPGETTGTPPPKSGATTGSEAAGPPGAAGQPNMPALPTNPQTGERAPGPPSA